MHCTLYCCTLTPTLTRRQSSALVTLSPAVVSDFCFKFCSVHSIGYNFHSTFHLRFYLKINSFFQIHLSVESKQRATTTLDFEHVFVALSFLVVRLHSLTLLALSFLCVSHSNLLIFVLSQTCHTFISSSIIWPYSGFQFLFFVGRVPNKPLAFANFL